MSTGPQSSQPGGDHQTQNSGNESQRTPSEIRQNSEHELQRLHSGQRNWALSTQLNSELPATQMNPTRSQESRPSTPALSPHHGPVQEQVFRSLVENSPDAIARFDRDFRYLYLNPVVARANGQPRSALLGKTFREIGMPVEAAEQWETVLGRVFATGEQEIFEFSFPMPDGERFFEALVVPEFGDDERVETILALARDVTEHKHVEWELLRTNTSLTAANAELQHERTRLRALIDSAPIGIVLTDSQGRFVLTNAMADELTGGLPTGTAYGPAGRYTMHHPDGSHLRSEDLPLSRSLDHGKVERNVEILFRREDGGDVHVLVNSSPIVDGDGALTGAVAVMQDITARKQAEAALTAYAERLQRSNQELELFAFAASHDLQEPLRKVRAFSEQIKTKFAPEIGEGGEDYINRMNAAVRRMEAMIQGLLDYSRVTTMANPFARVDLSEVMTAVLSDLEIRLEQTRGRVEAGELPVIQADPIQMRQLLQNLIGNALKFHRPNVPPVVTISARLLAEDDGDWVEFRVEDNGIGLDEQHKDVIFQPFQRLHGRSEYEGSGMGLAICRKIVERHGGQIIAYSTPGQGSTFSVTLPIRQTVQDQEGAHG